VWTGAACAQPPRQGPAALRQGGSGRQPKTGATATTSEVQDGTPPATSQQIGDFVKAVEGDERKSVNVRRKIGSDDPLGPLTLSDFSESGIKDRGRKWRPVSHATW
jgi:hypothetical protein